MFEELGHPKAISKPCASHVLGRGLGGASQVQAAKKSTLKLMEEGGRSGEDGGWRSEDFGFPLTGGSWFNPVHED
jgi:hypothetical protein